MDMLLTGEPLKLFIKGKLLQGMVINIFHFNLEIWQHIRTMSSDIVLIILFDVFVSLFLAIFVMAQLAD